MSREPRATTPLRMLGYAAILAAMSFSQSPGTMVADTKFDLLTNPGGFLGKALRMWDPTAAFGQLQNQAYGYAWPMGPFFWAFHALAMPPWMIQRLWWTLLLCLAFFGVVRLAQRLDTGVPWTQVAAGAAYVLTPRMLTLLGPVSVELWPMAIAPWVLLPLVRATQDPSTSRRRAAALSALAVACCGGVNAVAVAAVLPLGVLWLLTRARGSGQWRLLGWWTGFTVLATAWWSGPLVLLGRYSPAFLDYIENATITSTVTDSTKVLLGTSDWVAYFDAYNATAGNVLVSTPFLLLDAAVVAGFGLAGVLLREHDRRFLALGVLTGVVLVGLSYAGPWSGWFAADRQAAFDGALAPLRNLHKFDVVLRLPLVLGLGHLLAVLPRLFGRGARAVTVLRFATIVALLAMLTPWVDDDIAPRNAVDQVPGYWSQVASYLHAHDDGTTALELPASGFGVYTWGNVHDDVMQGYAQSPWAVRNIIPLAQPGNVMMLDAVTKLVESGRPDPALTALLRANGVSRLVVRNDLDRFETAAPDPAYVRSVLSRTPGITLERSFGPRVGAPAYSRAPDGTRLVTNGGISLRMQSVDVYRVSEVPAATMTSATDSTVMGDPGSLAGPLASLGGVPRVLEDDRSRRTVAADAPVVLTDGMRKQEEVFAGVRWNHGATLLPGQGFALAGPEHQRRFLADQGRWSTTLDWSAKVSAVTSSSSDADATAKPPIDVAANAGAAVDGDPSTAWRSRSDLNPLHQWWEVDLRRPRAVSTIVVRLAASSAPVKQLVLENGQQQTVVPAPAPGRQRTYNPAFGEGRRLRVTAAGEDPRLPGSFALAEVRLGGVRVQRYLDLPTPRATSQVSAVALQRDQGRLGCVPIDSALVCDPLLSSQGEDGDTLARRFTLPSAMDARLSLTGSLRRTTETADALQRLAGVRIDAPVQPGTDVAASAVAMSDGDPATTWTAPGQKPTIRLRLADRERLRELGFQINLGASASVPRRIEVEAGSHSRTVTVPRDGQVALPGWRTDRLTIKVRSVRAAAAVTGEDVSSTPAGISELTVNGSALVGRLPRGCGSGPTIGVAGGRVRTRVSADLTSLLAGDQVDLAPCGSRSADRVRLPGGQNWLIGRPDRLFRVDSALLSTSAAKAPPGTRAPIRWDSSRQPTSVSLPERSTARVLTLPMNYNAGWEASLGGRRLAPVRVEGWAQGWHVPAGSAGTARLTYAPAATFSWLLAIGAVLVMLVVAAAVAPVRRRDRERARPEVGDSPSLVITLAAAGVAVLGAGVMTGWVGAALAAVGAVLGLLWWRPGTLAASGAVAVLASSGSVALDAISRQDWALDWGQLWAAAAVGVLAAGVTAREGPRGSRVGGRRRRSGQAA